MINDLEEHRWMNDSMRQYAVFHHYPPGGTIITSDLWPIYYDHTHHHYYGPVFNYPPIYIGYGQYIYY